MSDGFDAVWLVDEAVEGFAGALARIQSGLTPGTPVEVWFQDEMHRHRHPQPGPGRAHLRQYRLHVSGPDGGVHPRLGDVHEASGPADPGLIGRVPRPPFSMGQP